MVQKHLVLKTPMQGTPNAYVGMRVPGSMAEREANTTLGSHPEICPPPLHVVLNAWPPSQKGRFVTGLQGVQYVR
jgi:hypothetical protein